MMLATGLLYLSLFALAARMQRHRPVLLGPWQRHSGVRHLEPMGWTLFVLSLASLWRADDPAMAIVAWTGLLPLLAGLVMIGVTYLPAMPRMGVVVGTSLIVLDLLPSG